MKAPLISLNSPSEDIVQASGAKRKRTNWGKGEAHDRTSTAVEDWLGEKGLRYDDNEELIMDRTIYANRVGIPRDSIYRYIHPDANKRKLLGDGSRGQGKNNDER